MWVECPAALLAPVPHAYVLWQPRLFHPTKTSGVCHKNPVEVALAAVAAENLHVVAVCSRVSREDSENAVLETKEGRLYDDPRQVFA